MRVGQAIILMIYLCLFSWTVTGQDDDPGGEPFPPGEAYYVEATIEGDAQVYLGEQVIYVFRIYVQDSPGARSGLLQTLPPFDGFWQAGAFEPRTPPVTVIGGQQYQILESIVVLYPARTGQLTIQPARLEVFENLFREAQMLATNPVTVDVLSLPDDAPPTFNGAVGQFTLDVTLDRRETRLGEPVTMTINLTGEGNVQQIPAPNVPVPIGWRVFENRSRAELQSNIAGLLLWSRDFEVLLVPGRAGTQELPPLVFAYFDPASESYVTVEGPTFTVDVLPGVDGLTALEEADAGQTAFVPSLREFDTATNGRALPLAPWWSWLLPLLGLILVVAGRQGSAYLGRWRRQRRQVQAYQRAHAMIEQLSVQPYVVAVSRLREALLGYMWDKLGYSTPLESHNIPTLMNEAPVPPRHAHAFTALLTEIEALPYAPEHLRPPLEPIYSRALKLLAAMDRQWGRE